MEDRRHHPRFQGWGLMVIVSGKLIPVLDISFGGIRIAKDFPITDGPLTLTVIPRQEAKLDLNAGVAVQATVVRVGETDVALQFTRVSYPLTKLIVASTAVQLGVEPHLVK